MVRVRSLVSAAAVACAMVLVLATPGPASSTFPDSIELPDGFRPEGIAIGAGTTFYVGSIPTGNIFHGDLRTGEGTVLDVPDGRAAIGLEVDRFGRLFVAGGPTGQAYVYDASGTPLASYQLTTEAAFINDVVVTGDGAWFTNSMAPTIYRVPIAADGTLGDQSDVIALPVGGDYVHQEGFNLNGIEADPQETLISVQSNTGLLFAIDPATGIATRIDLGGGDVMRGDGLLRQGPNLYVVQNVFNRIAVVRLSHDLSSGTIESHITDPDFDVPTTVDRLGHRLYLVQARFGVADPDTAAYWVEQVSAND